MNYATGHAISTGDIFSTLDTKKIKTKHRGNKKDLAKSIFIDCVSLVLEDMIENNVTFELPTRSKKCKLRMKRIDGDDFIKCRQGGKFSDIDFLKSNFTGYQMVFDYQNGGIPREKNIYLNPDRRDRITKYTNEGKSYY